MGENFFGQNIFGPPITLPCPTYNHHLFTPPSSVIFKDECYGRTKDELTDRTHTRIVSFIVLDIDVKIGPPSLQTRDANTDMEGLWIIHSASV